MTEHERLTIEILRGIREELVTFRQDVGVQLRQLGDRIDGTNDRIDGTNGRLSVVESTLLEMAEQQRFVVRQLGALGARDRRIETEVDDLKARVDKIEERLGTG